MCCTFVYSVINLIWNKQYMFFIVCIEASYLGENIEKCLNQKVAQNDDISLGYISSPSGEKSPNLVTLPYIYV